MVPQPMIDPAVSKKGSFIDVLHACTHVMGQSQMTERLQVNALFIIVDLLLPALLIFSRLFELTVIRQLHLS